MKDLEGCILKSNTLEISYLGLVNSLRKKEDGIVYFGCDHSEGNTYQNDFLCDYYINSEYLNLKVINPVFTIYFNQEYDQYFIKNNTAKEQSSLILLKLHKPIILNRKELLAIGDLLVEVENIKKKLYIRILHGKEKECKNYEFDPEQSNLVTLGRDKSNSVSIDNKSLSKVSITFKYIMTNIKDLEKNSYASNSKRIISKFIESDFSENSIIRFWEIHDGSLKKQSTNGVWMFLSHSFSIYDGLIMKLGKTKTIFNIVTKEI